ncbi:phage tail protein [Paenibacillus campi]|uniref:phage tail protein n=1 Tax=Paenibacillus campi TaxID=3106031 RepID=UPI002AFF43F6|nr:MULTISPECIES: tail fiber protein [unclassified Paenibacillus]
MDAYIGEIRLFAGNYAPNGWLFCNGQELPVQTYQGLYATLGNQFGGTSPRTFKLPDLSGNVPIHRGAGPGLTPRNFADKGGVETITLTTAQLPSHTHTANSAPLATSPEPAQHIWANNDRDADNVSYGTTINAAMNATVLGASGGGKAHTNMQPYLGVNYIICYDGEYPSPE